MKFVHSNPKPEISGAEELPGKVNYFIGNDPKAWHTGLATYAKVQYKELYPGIDLVYYGSQGQLEYDLVVHPGADPSKISLDFRGADGLEVDAGGDLLLHTTLGTIRQRRPSIYQEISGVRREISGGYALKGSHHVEFKVATYDDSLPLIIDPVLFFSTYLGGSGDEIGRGVTVDASGNAYVVGQTGSSNFPTTVGTVQTYGGGGDAFVTKLNPTGSGLVYSTFLGGMGGDFAKGIAVDGSGNAYMTGATTSTNFPTTAGAFQTTYGGGEWDAWVAKLNPSGSLLLYSTYLGGSDADFGGEAIAVDAGGNAYMAGETRSRNYPTTAGAFQTSNKGFPTNCVVTKLNPSGSALVYSTYFGGSAGFYENAFAIALDATGNAYVTGRTDAADFPTTAGAFQTTFGGRVPFGGDAYVLKLNPLGSGLVYSTYLGGSGYDDAEGIAVDAAGDAFVAGVTGSTNFPTTANALQPTYGGGTSDAFVTKLNALGSGLVYSTYLGGNGNDQLNQQGSPGLAADTAGNTYVTGLTSSTNFPTTASAFQATYGGGTFDAFVTKLNALGSGLVYSTYLGGSGDDLGEAIAIDTSPNPSAYLVGYTGSLNFPTTPGAFQTIFGGGSYDAFVAKITQDVAKSAPPAFAYVTNVRSNNVSVIDTATNQVVATVAVGSTPFGVAVTSDGTHTYVTNRDSNSVSVIDTATNQVVTTVAVGSQPLGVAITPDGAHAYVTNANSPNVSVIDTVTNQVMVTVRVGIVPIGVAITPDGTHAYVANEFSNNVSVIDTVTNQVVATIAVGTGPFGVAITPDGAHAYVVNEFSNNVSVIDTATNQMVATVAVGPQPVGVAITPDGAHAYVTNQSNIISVIGTVTNQVVASATVPAGTFPFGVAITPDGAHAYVANGSSNNVSVIDTATNQVVATVAVGYQPTGVAIRVRPTCSVITPSPSMLPAGTVGVGYSQTFSASPAGVYRFTSTGALPPGLVLSSSGTLSGTPTAAGTFGFSIKATDPNGCSGSQSYTVAIQGGITTTTVTASPNSSVFGQQVTFTATVNFISALPTPGPAQGATITFKEVGTILAGPISLISGSQASFNTSTLPIGSHTITAEYSGNANFQPSTGSVTQVVNKTPTSTILTSSKNPLTFGEAVSLTATATSAFGTPSGFVQLFDGPVLVGVQQLDGTGSTIFSFTCIAGNCSSTLSAGFHSITAVYNGDSSYDVSASPRLSIISNKAPTSTSLQSSSNPSTVGSTVILTATVISTPAGIVNGTVEFISYADDTPTAAPLASLGTATLDGTGKASLSISTLAAGSYWIRALYSGAANYLNSTSPTLLQVVSAPVSASNPSATFTAGATQITTTFSTVTSSGNTTVQPVAPDAAGQLPGGFSLDAQAAFVSAYQIATTAAFAGPITICFNLPSITDPVEFDQIVIYHAENGVLMPKPTSHDVTTGTVCAAVDSLSPFALMRVKPATTQLQELMTLVRSFNLDKGIENSFNTKLQQAYDALGRKPAAVDVACNALKAFTNEVAAQTEKALSTDRAKQLNFAAARVEAVLNCGRPK
jgi:YVTN family beta-propeller protein